MYPCAKTGRAGQERLHQPVGGDHGAEGGVAGGDPLGAGDHVRLVAVALRGEHVAEPAERADDLVADQQHVVLVADLAHPLEVAGRWREAAAGVLHRLEEHRSDGVGALVLDGHLDLVRGPAPEGLEVLRRGERLGGPVEVGVRHPERRGHQRLELGLEAGQAGDRQGALRGAVVGDRAADHLVLHGLAGQLEVVLRELPGRLHGLAAAAGEEHPVEVAGGVVRDPLGELDGVGVGVGPEREEGQLAGLPGGGLGQLRAAVPELAGEQPGQCVEVAAALGVVHVGALTADDDRHVGVVVARHPGEVHPEVLAGGLLETGVRLVVERQGRLCGRGRHGWRSSSVDGSMVPVGPPRRQADPLSKGIVSTDSSGQRWHDD